MGIKNRLKELRLEKELTQGDLSKQVGISRSNISKYESGDVDIGNELLATLASFFDVTTDYLLGISPIRNPYEPELIAAHKEGEEWTDEELAAIEALKSGLRASRKKGK